MRINEADHILIVFWALIELTEKNEYHKIYLMKN